uniref:Uncharacterized protein n=1 Tax=Knipowitschia caucasica TaxID=637954 RepID=A0AAV2IWC8_KNICA
MEKDIAAKVRQCMSVLRPNYRPRSPTRSGLGEPRQVIPQWRQLSALIGFAWSDGWESGAETGEDQEKVRRSTACTRAALNQRKKDWLHVNSPLHDQQIKANDPVTQRLEKSEKTPTGIGLGRSGQSDAANGIKPSVNKIKTRKRVGAARCVGRIVF